MQYSPATQAINLAQLMVQYMKPVKVEMETVSSQGCYVLSVDPHSAGTFRSTPQCVVAFAP